MAGGIEVAKAFVTIIPSMDGIQAAIARDLVPAAEKGGKDAGDKAGKGISEGAAKGGKEGGDKAGEGLRVGAEKATDNVSKSVQERLSGAFGKVSSSVSSKFQAVGTRISGVFSKAGSFIAGSGFGQAVSGVASKVSGTLTKVVGTVKGVGGAIGSAMSGAVSKVGGAFSTMKGAASEVFGAFSGIAGKIGPVLQGIGAGAAKVFAGIAKAAAAGLAAAGATVGVLAKQAFDGFKEFQQLEGGISKLYGTAGKSIEEYAASVGKSVGEVQGEYGKLESAQKLVFDNASKAYATAGMSANEYMQQATTFSASLIKSLNGDTEKAAQLTDVAIRAMSDNVNTFGSDAQSVQDAFNGFAKQNYTMLDNLKLGYAGTKAGMVELVKDSGVLGDAAADLTEANLDEKVSFAQIVEAIQAVQEQQGIAGTTYNEYKTTVEGSINACKAAWSNWLTELGKDEADMGARTTELVETIGIAAQNIVPRVAQIAGAVIQSLPGLIAQIGQTITSTLVPMIDEVTGGAASKVLGVLEPLATRLGAAFDDFGQRMAPLAPVVADIAGKLGGALAGAANIATGAVEMLLPLIASAANALLPALSAAIDVVVPIVGGIADAVGRFASALIGALQPAIDAIGPLLSALGQVLVQVGSFIGEHVMPVVGDLAEMFGATLGAAISIVAEAFAGLTKSAMVPDITTGGLDTVAVRMPSNGTAYRLIKTAKRPIAAPSANISGRPSPTNAEDVLEDMDGRIDAVIMGEQCDVGIESTVLDMTGEVPVILRPGILSREYLSDVLGKEVVYDRSLLTVPDELADPEAGAADTSFRPRSPGMKYRHYSPKADVILIEGSAERFEKRSRELGLDAMKQGKRTAIIDYGDDPKKAAHKFFSDLRELDRQGYDLILVRALDRRGRGFGVMNRMLKSAGYEVF